MCQNYVLFFFITNITLTQVLINKDQNNAATETGILKEILKDNIAKYVNESSKMYFGEPTLHKENCSRFSNIYL